MYLLVGAAFGVAAALFDRDGDPFVGLLLLFCAIVWIATTPVFPRPRGPRRPPTIIRME
jgi:hypothetical protein